VPMREYTPSKQDTVQSTRAEGVVTLNVPYIAQIITKTNAAHLSPLCFSIIPRHTDASLPSWNEFRTP